MMMQLLVMMLLIMIICLFVDIAAIDIDVMGIDIGDLDNVDDLISMRSLRNTTIFLICATVTLCM